jgi:hypothetical protein
MDHELRCEVDDGGRHAVEIEHVAHDRIRSETVEHIDVRDRSRHAGNGMSGLDEQRDQPSSDHSRCAGQEDAHEPRP